MPNDYSLYDFQVEGVDWLTSARQNIGGFEAPPYVGLIGDEMGLGKTAQALSAVKDKIKQGKRILFLVPGATIIQWQKNFDRWINDCETDEFGGAEFLFALRGSEATIPASGCVVMSHTLLARKVVVEKLVAANFDGLIIDEVHKFGADSSKRLTHLHALTNLSPKHFEEIRILLSGTPVRNYAKEIYNIAHILDPEQFRTKEKFAMDYLTWDRKALYDPQKFHRDFAPYYIRRTVAEVQKSLPSIRRTKLYTEITDPFIRSAYNKQLDLMSNFMNNAGKLDAFSLLGYLQKLRHITGIAKAKEPSIIEPIREYLESQGSAVIGLHHHFVNDRLKKSLPEFPFVDIRGGMTDMEKERAKLKFIEDSRAALKNETTNPVCYLSIKAAAEGIDGLQYASRKAYVFERQWNGADELQFEKRLHRTGQTGSVDIEYTIAAGTVDEFFDEMVEMKRRITTQVEDVNYESNPAFMKQLAEKVIMNRLPSTPTYANMKEFERDIAG